MTIDFNCSCILPAFINLARNYGSAQSWSDFELSAERQYIFNLNLSATLEAAKITGVKCILIHRS